MKQVQQLLTQLNYPNCTISQHHAAQVDWTAGCIDVTMGSTESGTAVRNPQCGAKEGHAQLTQLLSKVCAQRVRDPHFVSMHLELSSCMCACCSTAKCTI
jgi:hypothetical protein